MKLIEKFKDKIYYPIYRFFKWGWIRYPIKTFKRFIHKWIFLYRVGKHYVAGWEMVDWVFWSNGYAIIDYVENGGIEQIDWNWDDRLIIYTKIIECYAYFKYQIHNSKKLEDFYLDEWCKEHKHWWEPCVAHKDYSEYKDSNSKLGEIYWNILKDLEEQHYKTEEEMLHKVIEVRNYLWS